MQRFLQQFLITSSIALLFGCAQSYDYEKVYDARCDYVYKEYHNPEKVAVVNKNCTTSNCVLPSIAIGTSINALSASSHGAKQHSEWLAYKKACAKKGITVTEKPTGEVIYTNRKR